jgi:hypothetical protein
MYNSIRREFINPSGETIAASPTLGVSYSTLKASVDRRSNYSSRCVQKEEM